MPLITDLPASSSLATSDYLIKDTGSATQKIAVSSAYASATAPGLVSTGAQTIAGAKTFQANYMGIKSGIAYPGILFSSTNLTSYSDRLGSYRFNYGATTPTQARAYIEEASFSSGTPTGYYESYLFPVSDSGLSANQTYNILTSKTHQFVEEKVVTIPANGSVALTFAAYTRAFIVANGYSNNSQNAYIATASTSTIVQKALGTSSQLTVTTSGLQMTIANAHTSSVMLSIITTIGAVSAS